MKVIEWSQRCDACKGTGLYVGFAERAGAAVVCHRCKGTGKEECHVEYEEFTGRVERHDVTTVFVRNIGIGLSPDMPGGISYADWRGGAIPNTLWEKRYLCPDQKAQMDGLVWDGWAECLPTGARWNSCPRYADKAACWRRWDEGEPA